MCLQCSFFTAYVCNELKMSVVLTWNFTRLFLQRMEGIVKARDLSGDVGRTSNNYLNSHYVTEASMRIASTR